MEKEMLEKMKTVWTEKEMMLFDARESGEKELLDKAYHDLVIVEEVLSEVAGLTDNDFDQWGEEFWYSLKRLEE